MAEEQQNQQNQASNNKPKLYTIDKDSKFAANIDKLFFQWFDEKTYDLRKNTEENINTVDSLDILTSLVKRLQTELSTDKSKEAVELRDKLADFISGNANAATEILNDRPRGDHVSKLLWLINSLTTISVLSGELAETGKPLQHGPLASQNVTSQNIEQVMIPTVSNSGQMKSASGFLKNVLPKTFAAVAKHVNLVRAAATRAAVTGNEYHNQPTMDSMYKDLGEALIFVSTAFFSEANRAFTETGKRIAADRMKNLDFNKLSAKKQDKMMQLLRSAFRQYANLTASANTFSSINDKIMMDAAYAAWYTDMNDQEKKESGFNDKNLTNMTYVRAFARKYRNLYERHYVRYSNLFVDGMTTALKKEQETVKKDWFENKITGEREFRRGRLAGHGAKFMHTGPMEWLDKKLTEKKWNSLWIFPKLAFKTLKIITNPTLHKARKKLTGALFAGLRSFAQGVHEGFTKTGQSTEITYEDVIKKLKEATDKFNKLKDDKAIITNESLSLSEGSPNFTVISNDEDDEEIIQALNSFMKALKKCKELYDFAMSDESTIDDRVTYNKRYAYIQSRAKRYKLLDRIDGWISDDSDKSKGLIQLAKEVKSSYIEFKNDFDEFAQKLRTDVDSYAQDYESSGNTIQVGEQAVQICQDVFATLNKYIARQWNLLAAHSDHPDMPLCVRYTWIDTPDIVNGAVKPNKPNKPRSTSEMTLTDWLYSRMIAESNASSNDTEAEAPNDSDKPVDNTQEETERDRKARHDDVMHATAAELRDRRAYLQGNNGSNTADYPKKYNDQYRYHGLMLTASSVDKSKNGFGIFADRLLKIAEPVHDFCETVELVGNETVKKTFNNADKRDESATYFDTALTLNEDIGNMIVKGADWVKDKAANKAKSGVNILGKGAGHAIGSLFHGITHTSTADKDENIAKTIEDETGLTYSYNKSLKLSYVRDGAKILSKHCLTGIAKRSFADVEALATALMEANLANAHSIKAVSDALKTFAEKVKSLKFEPCKTVIDWQFANTINNGGIDDDIDGDSCMIKGIKIINFDSAKEYASQFTDEDWQALLGRGMKDHMIPRADWEVMKPADRAKAFVDAKKNSYNHALYDERNKQYTTKDIGGKFMIIPRDKWKSMSSEERKTAFNNAAANKDLDLDVPCDENYVPYAKEEIGESFTISFDDLPKLFEQVNNIDWKEVFNG